MDSPEMTPPNVGLKTREPMRTRQRTVASPRRGKRVNQGMRKDVPSSVEMMARKEARTRTVGARGFDGACPVICPKMTALSEIPPTISPTSSAAVHSRKLDWETRGDDGISVSVFVAFVSPFSPQRIRRAQACRKTNKIRPFRTVEEMT